METLKKSLLDVLAEDIAYHQKKSVYLAGKIAKNILENLWLDGDVMYREEKLAKEKMELHAQIKNAKDFEGIDEALMLNKRTQHGKLERIETIPHSSVIANACRILDIQVIQMMISFVDKIYNKEIIPIKLTGEKQ